MKRLLIATANFPPTNAVDMHRVRLSLPYYRVFGYEPTVLCFEPESTEHPVDPLLCESVPEDVRVIRVRCQPVWWTRLIGLNAVGFRGWPAMRDAGLKLLAEERHDLVLFSTTSFPLMTLGRTFQAAHGVPYVLDFQDHWFSPEDSILQPTLKNRLVRRLHARLEAQAVPGADGIIAVSDEYLKVLNQRYPRLAGRPQDVIPFCAADQDLEIARSRDLAAVFPPSGDAAFAELRHDLESRVVGLYAGAYVESMEPMVRALFQSVKRHLGEQPSSAERLRLWFVGSNYTRGAGEQRLRALAGECGVDAVVREWPQRIPYYDALTLLQRAAFCLLFGSTSKGYNPSKLFTLLRTNRPVLAFAQPATRALDALVESGGAVTIAIDPSESEPEAIADCATFLQDVLGGNPPQLPLNERFLQDYSAVAMTQRQTALFDRVLEATSSKLSEVSR
jgi:hypothetical protein